jgi:hypothetical protein
MHCNQRIVVVPGGGVETYCRKPLGHDGSHEVFQSIVPASSYAKAERVTGAAVVQQVLSLLRTQRSVDASISRCPHGFVNTGNCPQCRS